jgi:hypothetical protein
MKPNAAQRSEITRISRSHRIGAVACTASAADGIGSRESITVVAACRKDDAPADGMACIGSTKSGPEGSRSVDCGAARNDAAARRTPQCRAHYTASG